MLLPRRAPHQPRACPVPCYGVGRWHRLKGRWVEAAMGSVQGQGEKLFITRSESPVWAMAEQRLVAAGHHEHNPFSLKCPFFHV